MLVKTRMSWEALIGCILCTTFARAATMRDFTVAELKPYRENPIPVVVLAVDFQLDEPPAVVERPGKAARRQGAVRGR